MKKYVDDMVDNIIRDNYQAVRQGLYKTVLKIEQDFYNQGKIYLDNYYNEYSPDYYKRTNNLRDNSLRKYHKYTGFRLTSVETGISFSTEGMDIYKRSNGAKPWETSPFNTLEDYVLYNAMEGYHGREGLHDGTKIDTEMQRYTEWYDGMVHNILRNNIAKFI